MASAAEQQENPATYNQPPLTSPTPPPPPSPSPPTTTASSADVAGQLKWYYARLFPVSSFTRWIRYGQDNTLSHREISFTLPGDIYTRFRSFDSEQDLHDALKTCSPLKIDIGAIYNFPPAKRHTACGTLTAMQKELVFDIDMTDYADVLGDMAGGSAVEETDRSWDLMAIAVRVIHEALVHDFGFRHIMWVYSGRRGVHCWVSDERARNLSNDQRAAITDYLYLRFEDKEQSQNQQVLRRNHNFTLPLHPAIARARKMCHDTFTQFSLRKARVLSTDDAVRNVCAFIPGRASAEVSDRVRKLGEDVDPLLKWQKFEKEVTKLAKTDWSLRGLCDYIVLRHTYPRLDANVSKELNHLLKAPFSVHPKTNRVCVPFDVDDVEAFKPEVDAPVVGDLLKEMGDGKGRATEKMKHAVSIFQTFVDNVEKEAMKGRRLERLDDVDRKAALELLAH